MKSSTGYKNQQDFAIKDVSFDAWGDDPDQLFCAAARALANLITNNADAIQGVDSRSFHLCSENIDNLFSSFLQEILYYKDAQQFLLAHFQVTITFSGTEWVLNCKARGEPFDPLWHEQAMGVKAVALNRFEISRINGGWAAHVILDRLNSAGQ
jgi:SHS2 domain-containing protein